MNEIMILSIHFVMLGISLAIPIGPIKLEMIKHGLYGGFWPSWLVGIGAVCADILFMSFIFLGLSPFLHHKWVTTCMLLTGIIMLSYLGISTIRNSVSSLHLIKENNKNVNKPFWTGFVIALMNPYNFMFWFGVYGGSLQSIPSTSSVTIRIGLSFCIIIGIILWNLNVAFTVHFFRTLIKEVTIRWVARLAGIGLLAFSSFLAFKLFTLFS
ncbi:LysE family transporter [Fictibacillus nanhaiensis]|uniref:LysE family translocator n=1 Tax=Fictibacillus nanhaiensis TaxID=742169 RepID=UPI002E222FA0|nr:LysE family transporter [Fictibacillus nanhaiensis]MED1863048.1 LysE family transporter [Fictibacillus nanhaiensis]